MEVKGDVFMNKKREIEVSVESTVDSILRIESNDIPKFVMGTPLENPYRQFLIMRTKAKKYEDVEEMEVYAKTSDFVVSLENMKKQLMITIDIIDEKIVELGDKVDDEVVNDFNDFRSVSLKSIVFDDIETKDEYLESIVTYICLTFMMYQVLLPEGD